MPGSLTILQLRMPGCSSIGHIGEAALVQGML